MKIILTESQYKRLFKESFPEDVETVIGNKVTKPVINIFKWCHKNTGIPKRIEPGANLVRYDNPITKLANKINKMMAIDFGDSLILSYNFYIRFNDEGNYDQYLDEDLEYFGVFSYATNVPVKSVQYASAESTFWVLATSREDAMEKLERGTYHDYDFEGVETDGWGYQQEWEMTNDGVDVDDIDDIEYDN
jgi:hypothetical protein